MNNPNQGLSQGSQKVVYDHILARIPGGVHVTNDAEFKTLLVEGVLPAGTAIAKVGDDFKVIVDSEGYDYTTCVGLTEDDITADDFPLVSIVTDAVVRIDALPEAEATNFSDIKAVMPGLKAY